MKEIPEYLKDFLRFKEVDSLTEPQEMSLPYIIDSEGAPNLVVASPTGSGKTLIGELAIAETALIQKKKAAYLVPLKSLAKEKYDDLMEYESKYNLKVTLRTGDFDSDDSDITKFDLIVSTYEKWDSMTRRGPEWTNQIGAVVVDEAHMVTDLNRGATLECMLTRMRVKYPQVRLILLSAVMPNVQDFANWLAAKPVLSEYRAVPLKRGIFVSSGQILKHSCGSTSVRRTPNCDSNGCAYQIGGRIKFVDGSERTVSVPKVSSVIPSLCIDILGEGGQALVFAKSRAETIRLARDIGASIAMTYLNDTQKTELNNFVESKLGLVEDRYETETSGLLSAIRNGAAYHNAGMNSKLRRIVEEGFKNLLIKVIVATPTLAQGVNLPARRVIIQSIHRTTRVGKEEIPRWETENQMGRAGRRAYDKYGEAVLIDDGIVPKIVTRIGESDGKEDPLMTYLRRPVEQIESKLFTRTNILSHMLAEIAYASGGVDKKYIREFFSGTFGAKSGQISDSISSKVIEDSFDFLRKFLLIAVKGNTSYPTALGIKFSQKYVNPTNMENILFALRRAEQKVKSWETVEAAGWLHLACTAVEFSNVRPVYEGVVPISQNILLLDDEALFYNEAMEYGNVLLDYIEELPRNNLGEKYKVSYTDLMQATENAEWLLSTIHDSSVILKCSKQVEKSISETLLRVKKGVKAELLSLVSLDGVGRVWARKLYDSGIRTREDFLSPANWKRSSQILGGKGFVKKILQNNGVDVSRF